jgi:soluble lytic murein transglycosylase-like protein
MDEAERRYYVDRWNQFMSNERGLPMDYRAGIYQGIVDRTKQYRPELASVPTDMVSQLMFRESSYNPQAVSATGARGLMQVDPAAVQHMYDRGRLPEAEDMNLYNPEDNILAGMTYLDYLKRRYGGSWHKILQMYNLGPGSYQKGKRRPTYANDILAKGG